MIAQRVRQICGNNLFSNFLVGIVSGMRMLYGTAEMPFSGARIGTGINTMPSPSPSIRPAPIPVRSVSSVAEPGPSGRSGPVAPSETGLSRTDETARQDSALLGLNKSHLEELSSPTSLDTKDADLRLKIIL
jgi:hypothetical protein